MSPGLKLVRTQNCEISCRSSCFPDHRAPPPASPHPRQNVKLLLRLSLQSDRKLEPPHSHSLGNRAPFSCSSDQREVFPLGFRCQTANKLLAGQERKGRGVEKKDCLLLSSLPRQRQRGGVLLLVCLAKRRGFLLVFLLLVLAAPFCKSASTGIKAGRSWKNTKYYEITSSHTQPPPAFPWSIFRFDMRLSFVCWFTFEFSGSCFCIHSV